MNPVKILATMDSVALFAIVNAAITQTYWKPHFLAAFYLIGKGVYFFGDLNSYADIIIGVYVILMMFGVHTFFTYVAIIYLAQKIFFSYIA